MPIHAPKSHLPESEEQDIEILGPEVSPKASQMPSAPPPGEDPAAPSPQDAANNSPQIVQLMAMQTAANTSPQVTQLKAMQESIAPGAIEITEADEMPQAPPPPLQLKATSEASNPGTHRQDAASGFGLDDKTGLPEQLKQNAEAMSGYNMDDVRVHYNSSKPIQLQAHAYAQGSDIHLGPGQEKHLPHEAWHVVQQKQGRVAATTQLKGIGLNDDSALEKEADVMGDKMLNFSGAHDQPLHKKTLTTGVAQRVVVQIIPEWKKMSDLFDLSTEQRNEVAHAEESAKKNTNNKGGGNISGVDISGPNAKSIKGGNNSKKSMEVDKDSSLNNDHNKNKSSTSMIILEDDQDYDFSPLKEEEPTTGMNEEDAPKRRKKQKNDGDTEMASEKKPSAANNNSKDSIKDDDNDLLMLGGDNDTEAKTIDDQEILKESQKMLGILTDAQKKFNSNPADPRYEGMFVKEILVETRPKNLYGSSAGDHSTAFAVYAQIYRKRMKGKSLEEVYRTALEMFHSIIDQESERPKSDSLSAPEKKHQQMRATNHPLCLTSLNAASQLMTQEISLKRDQTIILHLQNAIAKLLELQELTPMAAVNSREINASEAGKGKGEAHRVNYLNFCESMLEDEEVLKDYEKVEALHAMLDLFDHDAVTRALMEDRAELGKLFSGTGKLSEIEILESLNKRHEKAITLAYPKTAVIIYQELEGKLEFEARIKEYLKAALINKQNALWREGLGDDTRNDQKIVSSEPLKEKREKLAATQKRKKEKKEKEKGKDKLVKAKKVPKDKKEVLDAIRILEKRGKVFGLKPRVFSHIDKIHRIGDKDRTLRKKTDYHSGGQDHSKMDNDALDSDHEDMEEDFTLANAHDTGIGHKHSWGKKSKKIIADEDKDKLAETEQFNMMLYMDTDRSAGKHDIKDLNAFEVTAQMKNITLEDYEIDIAMLPTWQNPNLSNYKKEEAVKDLRPKNPARRDNFFTSKKKIDGRTKFKTKTLTKKHLKNTLYELKIGSACQLQVKNDIIVKVKFGERPVSPFKGTMGAHSTAWIVHQKSVERAIIGRRVPFALEEIYFLLDELNIIWQERDNERFKAPPKVDKVSSAVDAFFAIFPNKMSAEVYGQKTKKVPLDKIKEEAPAKEKEAVKGAGGAPEASKINDKMEEDGDNDAPKAATEAPKGIPATSATVPAKEEEAEDDPIAVSEESIEAGDPKWWNSEGIKRLQLLPAANLADYIHHYMQLVNFIPGATYDVADTSGHGEAGHYGTVESIIDGAEELVTGGDAGDTTTSAKPDEKHIQSKVLTFLRERKDQFFVAADGLLDMNERNPMRRKVLVGHHYRFINNLTTIPVVMDAIESLKDEYVDNFPIRTDTEGYEVKESKPKKKRSKKRNPMDDDFNYNDYNSDDDNDPDGGGGFWGSTDPKGKNKKRSKSSSQRSKSSKRNGKKGKKNAKKKKRTKNKKSTYTIDVQTSLYHAYTNNNISKKEYQDAMRASQENDLAHWGLEDVIQYLQLLDQKRREMRIKEEEMLRQEIQDDEKDFYDNDDNDYYPQEDTITMVPPEQVFDDPTIDNTMDQDETIDTNEIQISNTINNNFNNNGNNNNGNSRMTTPHSMGGDMQIPTPQISGGGMMNPQSSGGSFVPQNNNVNNLQGPVASGGGNNSHGPDNNVGNGFQGWSSASNNNVNDGVSPIFVPATFMLDGIEIQAVKDQFGNYYDHIDPNFQIAYLPLQGDVILNPEFVRRFRMRMSGNKNDNNNQSGGY